MSDKKKSDQVFYCSAASRYFQEALQGTAANYKGFVMVEHASPFPQKPTDGLLNKEWLKDLEKFTNKKGYKLLLIRNRNTNYKTCRVIYVDCIAQKYFVIQRAIDDVHHLNLELFTQSGAVQWEEDPFFVICTNGKKDKCCAKFGFPVFRYFENILLPFCYESYECTHLGGDRFAANAALMPYGIYYGRVGVEDVHNIIRQTAFGRVQYNHYRGKSRLNFMQQTAECYLREHLEDFQIDFPLEFLKKKTEADRITLIIQAGTYGLFQMVLTRKEIDYPHLLTCTSQHPEKIVKYHLQRLTPVNAK